MPGPREPTLGEIAEDVADIKKLLQGLNEIYLPREVYEFRHAAIEKDVRQAVRWAQWAVGLFGASIFGGVVTLLLQAGGGG
jgi:hypothetical protein